MHTSTLVREFLVVDTLSDLHKNFEACFFLACAGSCAFHTSCRKKCSLSFFSTMAGSTSLTELYHGHFVLISTFILNFVALGAFNASGMYLDELKKTFPSSGNHLLPLFCTLQIVAGLASSLIGGIAQDILEKRGIGLQWLFFGGGAFMGLGFLFSSLCSTLSGVFFGSILFGIGLGFGGFLSGGVCVLWFEKYRGTMLLIAISGQGIGNVVFAWATAKILNHFRAEMIEDPWRPTMQIMGLLSFALCTMASVAMRIPFDGEVKEYESRNDDNRKGKEKYGSTMVSPRIGARTRVNRKFERISMENHHVISSHNFNRGSFQGLGNGTLRKFSDFHQGYETIQPANKLLVSNSGLFDTILQSMPMEEEEEEEDMEKYTLSQLIYSSTSIWLNTFTLIACFPLLNLQGKLHSFLRLLLILQNIPSHVPICISSTASILHFILQYARKYGW